MFTELEIGLSLSQPVQKRIVAEEGGSVVSGGMRRFSAGIDPHSRSYSGSLPSTALSPERAISVRDPVGARYVEHKNWNLLGSVDGGEAGRSPVREPFMGVIKGGHPHPLPTPDFYTPCVAEERDSDPVIPEKLFGGLSAVTPKSTRSDPKSIRARPKNTFSFTQRALPSQHFAPSDTTA